MKRTIVLLLLLNMITRAALSNPAGDAEIAHVARSSIPFHARFNHCRPAPALSNPVTWGQLTSWLQQVFEAGVEGISDILSRIIRYFDAKEHNRKGSASGVTRAMHAGGGFKQRVNAWRSGFEMARERLARKMSANLRPPIAPETVEVAEQIVMIPEEPAAISVQEPIISINSADNQEVPDQKLAFMVEPESKNIPEQEQAAVLQEQSVVGSNQVLPEPKSITIVPSEVVTAQETELIAIPAPDAEKERKAMVRKIDDDDDEACEQAFYYPRRKKCHGGRDLFEASSEFGYPEAVGRYQSSPCMNSTQQIPLYQQPMSVMMNTQPMLFSGYQAYQNPLNNAAIQMQSSAMALQAQANMLLTQAQQPHYTQQPYQQICAGVPSMRENTKQEKEMFVMQAIQQVIHAGEGPVQYLLHLLDLEFDILEHLLAGNAGQRVDYALRERNNAIKHSAQMVVTAYDRLMELATTYGNDDYIGARLYHYCVRKSKRTMQSSMVSRSKKKFLLHMMSVLEQYYDIIEKMLRVGTLHR